ncbi:MAG: hypothetical protein IPP31_01980 [Chitinophagaceae bacterium]|nr:hypothetical protein [Chitinophagaceae bacterium]
MLKRTLQIMTIWLLTTIVLDSCSKSNDTTPVTPSSCSLNVSFTGNIKRILDVNCNSCHAPGSGNASALSKWTYDGTYSSAFNRKSDINAQVSAGLMPQTGGLPQLVKDSVSCWVTKGAPN